MKKKAYKSHEKILMGVYILSLSGAITIAFMSEEWELHQSINLCIWITSTIMWTHNYITMRYKRNNLIEVVNTRGNVGLKALTSAPSALNTYEKSIYEEGFKDGVNYLKSEITTANNI